MSDSTTASNSFAPSWLRTSNHSPTPPLRSLAPSSGLKDRLADDWPERKHQNGFVRWNNTENHSDAYFGEQHNRSRGSEFEHDNALRRSNSINSNSIRGQAFSSSRANNSSQNLWNGRTKFENHFRQPNGGSNHNGFAFREANSQNPNGISYSFVTSKSLKPTPGPTSPVLQQSDFPSLNPLAESAAKPVQPTVWGNPPHLSKTTKRSQAFLNENGSTILGPHYGKGFLNGLGRNFKDDLNAVLSSVDNDQGLEDYPKHDSDDEIHIEETQEESLVENRSVPDTQVELDESGSWDIGDRSRKCLPNGSMLSSTGSTGSVESIDSHQSHMSGAAMMVEDLLDETISEDEKIRIMHALEEIKERTGYESYYERVALKDGPRPAHSRYSFHSDGKAEEEEEDDPDDRFLK